MLYTFWVSQQLAIFAIFFDHVQLVLLGSSLLIEKLYKTDKYSDSNFCFLFVFSHTIFIYTQTLQMTKIPVEAFFPQL